MCLNIRGITNKLEFIKRVFIQRSPSILVLSETKKIPDEFEVMAKKFNYHVVRTNANESRSGVAICVNTYKCSYYTLEVSRSQMIRINIMEKGGAYF